MARDNGILRASLCSSHKEPSQPEEDGGAIRLGSMNVHSSREGHYVVSLSEAAQRFKVHSGTCCRFSQGNRPAAASLHSHFERAPKTKTKTRCEIWQQENF